MALDSEYDTGSLSWLGQGANSYVYAVNTLVVVKVPKSGDEERERFRHELRILDILAKHPRCPSLITCYLHCEQAIFLQLMNDINLSWRIQQHHTRNDENMQVISVEKVEPLLLRKTWMKDLAQAVAFLESLNLAHGDLRPENILLDRDQIKLADFDCTAEIGSDYEACVCPYGRLLGKEAGPLAGKAGQLGPRTEQFALGSIFYAINYGFEVYGDHCLGSDPSGYEHGPAVVQLLQDLIFPALNGDPDIDSIIDKCWHGNYDSIADLAVVTEELLGQDGATLSSELPKQDDFEMVKAGCEEFIRNGLLNKISSKSPQELGIARTFGNVAWEML